MPSSQPLPPKEKNLFNRILKCYEQKQHRNGLKFAKQILSNPKFAEHGETLAMKGLTLSCTGKKEEAYELVKRGLKNDLKSHVCWHVYGLLQRSDKKYDEAIKCYRNALRWDKDNLHILRDLSMLQVHLRDLEGYRETRYKLLQLKPGQRASWIGYAISNHLLKDYMVAYKVLEEFFKVQQSQDAAYEMSELLLFQNAILREAGRYQQALDHLKDNEERIVDKLLLMESKGELLLSLGRLEEAEEIFTSLIYRNPENHKYFDNLERVIKPQNFEERLQIYQAVLNIFPKADSPKLIPLTFSKGEDFRTLLSKLMREQLKRGVPPLFVSLKPLYKDPDKVRIIGELVSQFIIHLKSISKFSPEDEQEEPPTTFLWARYFMAQHLTALHEYERALKMVNESLEHTPTLIELHVLKAKVLKHMGDTEGAMQSMDEAQSLDTADRYINCKCVAYMIRNDMLVEAEETVAKFTRENVSVIDYLREMQCMWYEVDFAAAHWRAQRYGKALQKCHEVDKHFTDIIDDQFDFHQYCMRKITLRSYVNMLKLEDGLRSHEFYFQAARIAIQVYLRLHDQPYKSEGGESSDQDSFVSGAELKKLRNKQRRQERKKAAAEEKRKQELEKSRKKRQQNKNEDEADTKKLVVFDPEKLASVADPLEQANRFLAPLQLFCAQRFDTHLFAFRIAQRRSKLLLMLRSLLRCQELADERQLPELHFCKVQFAKKVRNANGVASAVNDVIQQFMHQLFDGLDLEEFNSRFLDKNRDSLPHLFAGCRGMYHLDNGKRDEVVNMLLNVSLNTKNINLKACESVYLSLRNNDMGVLPGPTLEALREKFHQFHPRACVFMLQPEGKTSAQEAKKTPMSNGIEKHDVESAGDNDQKKIGQKELKPIDHASEPSALVENHCSHGD